MHGINELKTDAQLLSYNDEGRLTTKDVRVTLIPYYAWAHRGAGAMAVWLPQELSASRPSMPPTLASESKVDASHKVTAISAINDRLIPKDENDRSIPYYHWYSSRELSSGFLTNYLRKHWWQVLRFIGLTMPRGVVAECLKHGGFIIKIRQENGVLCKMQIRME